MTDREAVIERLFAAVNGRDLEAVIDVFDKAVVWQPAREDPDSASHTGHAGVAWEVDDRVYQVFTFRDALIVAVEEFYGRDEAQLALRASNERAGSG